MIYYIGTIPCESTDIKHFGITGMKWGIRRFRNPDGTLTEEGKRRYGSGSISVNNKKLKSMSDDEIRGAIQRMRLEMEYRKLYKETNPPSIAVSKGAKVASKVLSTAGSMISKVSNMTVQPFFSNLFRELGSGIGRSVFANGQPVNKDNEQNKNRNRLGDDED